MPDYSKELENIAKAFHPVTDIVWGEDYDDKYVEFVMCRPLENPVYFIKYREEYFNHHSNYA